MYIKARMPILEGDFLPSLMKRSIASIAALGITLSTVSVCFAHVPFASAEDEHRMMKPPVQISIGNDTYTAGEQVTVSENVNGNINIAAGKVFVTSTVAGDVQAAGGEVSVTGSVRDNLRVLSGNVSISGRVNGTVTVAAGELHIEKTAVVGGGLLVTGGTVVIDGTVNGMLKAYGSDVTVNGTVNGITEIRGDNVAVNGLIGGNAIVTGTSFMLGETARFNGNLDYWSVQGQRDLSAAVKGTATFRDDLKYQQHDGVKEGAAGFLAGITLFSLFSAAFVIGLLLFFSREFFKNAAKTLEKQPWMSLLIGFLYVILTPILFLVLLLTFIGIPLAVAVLAMYLVSLYFSTILSSMVFARWIEMKNKKKWNAVTIFFLSLGVFLVLKLLWVIPFLGWLVRFVLVMMGLGSLLAMKHHVYMKNR